MTVIKVVSIGIPGLNGQASVGSVTSVNNIEPDESGGLILTAADVGADEEGAAAIAEQNANDYADGVLTSANDYTDEGLAAKLDTADYVQHFKGKYTTLESLQSAYPTASDGDYAIVDGGVGIDAKQYIWDSTDNAWIESAITPASTTDEVAEGSTNLYFTTSRVRDVVLSGLSLLTGGTITATDSILTAFGKLQKQITDLFSNQRYQFVSDAGTTYTVPASAVTPNGNTMIELSNNSLTSITVDTNTATGKTVGDYVYVSIIGTYGSQALVASGVTLQGDLTFSYQHQTKCLIYKGSNTWKVVG